MRHGEAGYSLTRFEYPGIQHELDDEGGENGASGARDKGALLREPAIASSGEISRFDTGVHDDHELENYE